MASYCNRIFISPNLLKRLSVCHHSILRVVRPYSLDAVENENEESEIDDSTLLSNRNKSRMKAHYRCRMEENLQMPEILFDYQATTKYQRKLLAKFGRASGIDPSICWPTRSEIKEMVEVEKEFHPSLNDMLAKVEGRKQFHAERVKRR